MTIPNCIEGLIQQVEDQEFTSYAGMLNNFQPWHTVKSFARMGERQMFQSTHPPMVIVDGAATIEDLEKRLRTEQDFSFRCLNAAIVGWMFVIIVCTIWLTETFLK